MSCKIQQGICVVKAKGSDVDSLYRPGGAGGGAAINRFVFSVSKRALHKIFRVFFLRIETIARVNYWRT